MINIRPVSYGCELPPSLFERVARLVRVQGVRIGPRFGERKSPEDGREAAERPKTPEKRASLYDEGCKVSLLA